MLKQDEAIILSHPFFLKRIWKNEFLLFTLYFKVLFMQERNQHPDETLKDIKQLMERSSRFISLSGLSGVAAGTCGLVGAWAGANLFNTYYGGYNSRGLFSGDEFAVLKLKLLGLATTVFIVAFLSAFYFTWRRAQKQNVSLWDYNSKRLFWNMLLPLLAGAGFILGMLHYDEWRFVAPASLIFYGIALINASKYTLTDIRYLGYCEIILGLICMFFIGEGLYFWAIGFGLLHILYGAIMWVKYEK
jgi:hypothetical protein